MRVLVCMATALLATQSTTSDADSAPAACRIYPAGQDHTDVTIPCTFSQRQGYITISRSDGVTHELAPTGDTVGNFTDGDGRIVYRQSGLSDQGLIFRFPDESVYVYWNTKMLEPEDANSPTRPFTTQDYDATNRELEAHLEGDTWIVEFANGEIWEVPIAAIEGG